MDEIDSKIISILQGNARISMRELGGLISLSNTATAERVRRLEEAGVIRGYHADIRQSLLGQQVHAFILLEAKYEVRRRPEAFLQYARAHEHIVSVTPLLSGGLDYLLEIYCPDTAELNLIQQGLNVFGLTTTHLAGIL